MGTDNMTCIIIEFRDKDDNSVSPPVKNKNRKKKQKPPKKPEEESKKTPQDAIMEILKKRKEAQLEKSKKEHESA